METLTRLFTEYPAAAIATSAVFLVATILPFARRRFPGVFLLLVAAPISLVTTPFIFWVRNVKSLAAIAPDWARGDDGGQSYLTRRFLVALKGLIVLGGIFILTAGVLSGLRASGGGGNDAQRRAMLETELPLLERTLEDTRSRIEALDREWDLALSRHREEYRRRFSAPIRDLEKMNARLETILSQDPSTREIFYEFRNASAAAGSTAGIIGTLEAFLPASTLMVEKQVLLLQYFKNSRAREKMAAMMDAPQDTPARAIFQPDYEQLLRLRTELPPAIERVESALEIPDEASSFDAIAFLVALAPALIIFCAFIWAVGFMVDIFGVLLHPVAPQKGTHRGKSPEIDSTGKLIWAE